MVNGLLLFVSMVVVYAATIFLNTVNYNMNMAVVDSCTGDLQIHNSAQGEIDIYSSPPADTLLFAGADQVISDLYNINGIKEITQRLRMQGLLVAGSESASSVLTGIIADIERRVSPKIIITEGDYLTTDNGVIVGQALQEKLGIKVGDVLEYYINKSDGTIVMLEMIVEGIFRSDGLGMYMDTYVFCNIDFLRNKLEYSAKEVTEIVIRVNEGYVRNEVLADVQERMDKEGHSLTVRRWEDVAETYSSVIVASTLIPGALSTFVVFVVVLGLFNNIIMNFMERKGENGVLFALGTSKARLVGMFSSEYMLLGLIASVLALLVMMPTIYILGEIGITASSEIVAYIFGGYTLYLNIDYIVTFYLFALFTLIPFIVAYLVSAATVNKLALTKK